MNLRSAHFLNRKKSSLFTKRSNCCIPYSTGVLSVTLFFVHVDDNKPDWPRSVFWAADKNILEELQNGDTQSQKLSKILISLDDHFEN